MSKNSQPKDASPPSFVMWNTVPQGTGLDWKRQWFGHELDPEAVFSVRGIGIREPMFNPDVHRPIGTGDWLIMLFHAPVRLDPDRMKPSAPANTLILWPPGAKQFYSWGKARAVEPHSWMHVEGSWVQQVVTTCMLPVERPFQISDPSVMEEGLSLLFKEMQRGESSDPVILQNLFQNWAHSISRELKHNTVKPASPTMNRIRVHLDEHFKENLSLDELATMAGMSSSHLCHQFRTTFDTNIRKYIIRKRMSVAQRMLYDVNLRVSEIAESVGYPDIYQFSKQFKKSFGVSPTHYRDQQRL